MSFPSAQSPDVSADPCSLRALSLQNQPFFGKTACPNCRNKCPRGRKHWEQPTVVGTRRKDRSGRTPLVHGQWFVTRRIFWVGNKVHHGTTMFFFFSAVFLASFGTLSAIRYFRRQAREGRPRT